MITYANAELETGYSTVDEYVADWYHCKPLLYTTADLRKTYCDKCSDVFTSCEGCFLHDVMNELYKLIHTLN